jgi:hypothetical protein
MARKKSEIRTGKSNPLSGSARQGNRGLTVPAKGAPASKAGRRGKKISAVAKKAGSGPSHAVRARAAKKGWETRRQAA